MSGGEIRPTLRHIPLHIATGATFKLLWLALLPVFRWTSSYITAPWFSMQLFPIHLSHLIRRRSFIRDKLGNLLHFLHSWGDGLITCHVAPLSVTANADAGLLVDGWCIRFGHHLPTWAEVIDRLVHNLGLSLSDTSASTLLAERHQFEQQNRTRTQ